MTQTMASALSFQRQPRLVFNGSLILMLFLASSLTINHSVVLGQITSDDAPMFSVTGLDSDVPSSFSSDIPSSFFSDVPSSFDSDAPSSFNSEIPSPFVASDVPSSFDDSSDVPSSTSSSTRMLNDPIVCGKNNTICADNEYCCNKSCGICAPIGSVCILIVCANDPDDSIYDPKNDRSSDSPSDYGSGSTATTIPPSDPSSNPPSDPLSDYSSNLVTTATVSNQPLQGDDDNDKIVCGNATCSTGQYCCNESCSICAEVGGGCVELFCSRSRGVDGFADRRPSIYDTIQYVMPDETAPHLGTWLQWPHHYQYGRLYRNGLDQTWIDMTKALVTSENVFIIAYNNRHMKRIQYLLQKQNVTMKYKNNTITFYIHPTDDVWVRDNGPIFVRNIKTNATTINDYGFNGWGNKVDYKNCDTIPSKIATELGIPVINLNNAIVVEGGSFEIDGRGTFLATRSSIINKNRNPNTNQSTIEHVFTKTIGVTNFIWLDGVAGLEITDMHIDGFARFGTTKTIVTMNRSDLIYWEVPSKDIDTLYNAKDTDGKAYDFVYLPLTKSNVKTAYGKQLPYKGSYVNFYTANTVVLVPTYNDPNDSVAIGILKKLYPNHRVVGIDVRNLYENGGMVHCVTQQQPL